MKTLFTLLIPALLFAQSSSEHFTMTKFVIDAGGGSSSATNFNLISAFGQPTPIGVQNSANFTLHAGFLTPLLAVSPLSPIQRLVIREAQPNAVLYWESITGAGSYSIYRAAEINFTPSSGNFVAAVTDTFFIDMGVFAAPPTQQYYIVIVNNP